jgi:hypothetical protein
MLCAEAASKFEQQFHHSIKYKQYDRAVIDKTKRYKVWMNYNTILFLITRLAQMRSAGIPTHLPSADQSNPPMWSHWQMSYPSARQLQLSKLALHSDGVSDFATRHHVRV